MTVIKTKLTKALDKLKTKVGSTMGPNGYNVSIMKQRGMSMRVTKDGATVARECWDADEDINGFIKSVTEVARSVELEVGDGTTTSTVMSTTVLQSLMTLIDNGTHPRKIIRDMDIVLDRLIEQSGKTKWVISDGDLHNLVMVSTNHDKKMSDLVCGVIERIGAYGRFRTTHGAGLEDITNVTTGYVIDSGIFNPMLLDSSGRPMKVEGPAAYLRGELTVDALTKISQASGGASDLIIFCDRVNEDQYAEITDILMDINNSHGVTRIWPITLSSIPFVRNQQFDDINGLCGTHVSLIMERNRTTVEFDNEAAKEYIASVEELVGTVGSGYDLNLHKERVQRLRGGFANIMVSGATPSEAQERGDRIDDAILAAQSALREGYVIGGGNHYLSLLSAIETDIPEYLIDALHAFLTAVYRQVHLNSGIENRRIDDVINDYLISDQLHVYECIDFSDVYKRIHVTKYPIIDSAGTPVRVFEATRSLIHTLLPVQEHIEYCNTSIAM